MPKNKKRSAAIVFSRKNARYLVATALLSLSLLLAAFIVTTSIVTANSQSGQLLSGQVHSGENLQRSLDLSLALKASYPSSEFKVIQDLGSENGISKQIVSFSVKADGLTEYALVAKPAVQKPANGYPAIILCHGYVNPDEYKTEDGYIADMNFYAKNGFVVVKPDFRGQGLSIGHGVADSVYYSMAYNTDLMSLISAIKDTPYINHNNINLWGHSMGAYIALRAAVISKDVKNVILLSGPVGSLNQIYLTYVPPSDENNPVALRTRQAVFSKYGTPGEDTEFWRSASATNYLSRTSARYQIHVGALDSVVPPQLSKDLDNDLTELNRTHDYYIYPNGTHSLALQRELVWSRSLNLLREP